MPNEDLTPQEEVETTPAEGSESEGADADLESLFSDDETPEGEQPDDKIARLEKKVSDLTKGIAKAFSEKGRNKEQPKSEVHDKDDVNELFFTNTPNAELVEDDLQKVADAKYNGSVLKAWKNESWLKEKAQSIADAKKIEEENKSKIKTPSNGTPPQKKDLASVKPEDVEKLTPAEKSQWVAMQAEKARNSD